MTPKKTKTKLPSSNDFEIWDDSKETVDETVRTPQKKSTRPTAGLGTPSKTPSCRKTKALGESNSGLTPQKVAECSYKKVLEVGCALVVSETNDENAPRDTATVSKSLRNSGSGLKTLVSRRVRTPTNLDGKESFTELSTDVTQKHSEPVGVTTEHQIDDEEDEELLRMYANMENMPPVVPLPGVDPANDTAFGRPEEDEEDGFGSYSPTEHLSGMYGEQNDHQLTRTVSARDLPIPSSTTSSNRTTPIGAFTSPIPFEEFEAVTRKIVDATYEIRRGPLGELSAEHLIKDNWRVSIPSTSIISLSPSPTEAADYIGTSPVSRGMVRKKASGATPPPKILDGKSAIEHRLNHPLIKPSTNPELDFEIFEDKPEVERTGQAIVKSEQSLHAKIVRVSDKIEGTHETKDFSVLHYGDGFGDPGMNIIYMRQISMGSPPPPYTSSPPTPRSKSLQPAMVHGTKINTSNLSESDTASEQKFCYNNGSPNHLREAFEYKPSKLRIISTSPTSSSVNELDSTNSPCSSPSLSRNVQTQTLENVPTEPNKMIATRKKINPKLRKVPSQIRRTPPTRSISRSQSVNVPKSNESGHQFPITMNHNSVRRTVHQSRTTVKFVRSSSFSSFRDPVDPITCSPAPTLSPVTSNVPNADENEQPIETSPSAGRRRYYRRSRGSTPTDSHNHVVGTLMMESMRI